MPNQGISDQTPCILFGSARKEKKRGEEKTPDCDIDRRHHFFPDFLAAPESGGIISVTLRQASEKRYKIDLHREYDNSLRSVEFPRAKFPTRLFILCDVVIGVLCWIHSRVTYGRERGVWRAIQDCNCFFWATNWMRKGNCNNTTARSEIPREITEKKWVDVHYYLQISSKQILFSSDAGCSPKRVRTFSFPMEKSFLYSSSREAFDENTLDFHFQWIFSRIFTFVQTRLENAAEREKRRIWDIFFLVFLAPKSSRRNRIEFGGRFNCPFYDMSSFPASLSLQEKLPNS